MMKMLPDASGEILDELVTGIPTTLSYSYDMDLTFMEEPCDLAFIVFVQNDIDKSVLQSAMIDVTFPTGIENNLFSHKNVKLYPTLASDMIMIEFALDIKKN